MAYATLPDIRAVLSPAADPTADASSAASMDDAKLTEALEEAETEIDAKLGGRYTVPFDPVPATVANVARDIAAYLATLTFRRGNPLPPDDPVRLRYARARDLLEGAAKGSFEIVGVAGPLADRAEAAVENMYEGDLFTLNDFSLGLGGPLPRQNDPR